MTKTKTLTQLERAIEALARDHVNTWIELGASTADMADRRAQALRMFTDFLIRDTRKYAETGKYPEYA